ncbi:hypothetical protein SAMN05216184_10883 [Georgenia satyanarayanai]|uniref:Cell wall binding repeat 2 n=1 Tax=Georgenia satyanarayanai TaxID=860221 RepID=A0A2Y9ALH4_9MICO|nr:hypothetical protein [Georgenia satyanarayanai]PYF99201.1 hypothetical protein A8987_10883 [Georgenia satyanarayanai]SSA43319.1 hypothetical protein SAMN05216184_10883 [Georgenia satyanarayanai]
MSRRPTRAAALAVSACLVLAACSGEDGPDDSESPTAEPSPERGEVQQPAGTAVVLTGADGELALAASRTFFTQAPVVVLADDAEPASRLRASTAGLALGAPVLLDDDAAALTEELGRLEAGWVLTVGDATVPQDVGDAVIVPAPADDAALAEDLGLSVGEAVEVAEGEEVTAVVGLERGELTPLAAATDAAADDAAEQTTDGASAEATDDASAEATTEPADEELPATELPEPVTGTLALTTGAPAELLATATARAAGADVAVVPGGDPRATSESVSALSEAGAEHVVGLGDAFGDDETLAWRAATAASGVELPGGGQLVFPGKRYVALYGSPVTPALGVLGEQGTEATIARAEEHAEPYEDLVDDTVVPALEIIATVASSSAGDDGNYSNEWPVEDLRPLVEAAGEAGQYVVLDLQPGRSSFLEQAQLYAELLELPHVGLALDPEWNLGPDEHHMVRIGSVTAEEVNEVVDWLADFTRERNLPQKMLVLHQFQVRMIETVPEVDLSRSELAVLVHADGQGGQGAKQDTWRTLHEYGPDIQWWGWKNFYDEDVPMLTPEQTISQVDPVPHFITYQ